MEWWQAYLFWRLDVISGMFVGFTILLSLGFVITLVFRIFGWGNGYCYENERPEKKKQLYKIQNRVFLVVVPLLIICLSGALLVPTTETAIKIVVTKYGVDAITTDTMKNAGDNLLNTLEDLSKIINLKVKQLLPNEQKE